MTNFSYKYILKHNNLLLTDNIFLDTKLNANFNKFGYVKINLLDSFDVNSLLRFYFENPNNFNQGFHSTHFSKNRDYKRMVQEKILSTFVAPTKNYLTNYELNFGNFMVKESGERSMMPLHADWTYVDENKSVSLGIWCPLTDTNEKNGMLGVVPFSHNFEHNFRGPKIPSPFHDFNQYIIDNYGELIPVKAGEAIIYNHKTLHFSPENNSKETRVAINIVATPKEAPILHYANINDEIRKYKVKNNDFFVEYDHFETPDYNDFEIINTQNTLIINQSIIDKTLSKKNKCLLQKIKDFFSK